MCVECVCVKNGNVYNKKRYLFSTTPSLVSFDPFASELKERGGGKARGGGGLSDKKCLETFDPQRWVALIE